MRVEHDFLGEMSINDTYYYGIQTLRNVATSDVTGVSLGVGMQELLNALANIKKAAALANRDCGQITEEVAHAICTTTEEIIHGKYQEHFPVDILTGGGGIGINMNMNEVIAHRSNEILTGHKGYDVVHPNTHVNMGQSTNDVVPSAIHLALYGLLQNVNKECAKISQLFFKKSQEYSNAVKLSRTCLQDALPITFGQEFSGHVSFLKRQEMALSSVAQSCLTLSLGGTAVGTGVGTASGFVNAFYQHLASITGLDVKQSENLFDSMAHADIYSTISNTLKTLASGLSKIASDLRILSSGPRGGFGEIKLPELLPGSSIMPGKINPIIPELIIQIYFQVSGYDHTVSLAVERGDLNLNVWEAVIYKSLQKSCHLLERGIRIFGRDCIAGINVCEDVCYEQAKHSTALAALVAAIFGYEVGSECANAAIIENKSILDVVISKKMLSKEAAQKLLDPHNLLSGEKFQACVQNLKQSGDM